MNKIKKNFFSLFYYLIILFFIKDQVYISIFISLLFFIFIFLNNKFKNGIKKFNIKNCFSFDLFFEKISTCKNILTLDIYENIKNSNNYVNLKKFLENINKQGEFIIERRNEKFKISLINTPNKPTIFNFILNKFLLIFIEKKQIYVLFPYQVIPMLIIFLSFSGISIYLAILYILQKIFIFGILLFFLGLIILFLFVKMFLYPDKFQKKCIEELIEYISNEI